MVTLQTENEVKEELAVRKQDFLAHLQEILEAMQSRAKRELEPVARFIAERVETTKDEFGRTIHALAECAYRKMAPAAGELSIDYGFDVRVDTEIFDSSRDLLLKASGQIAIDVLEDAVTQGERTSGHPN